jgi:hypothetical protein
MGETEAEVGQRIYEQLRRDIIDASRGDKEAKRHVAEYTRWERKMEQEAAAERRL